MQLTPDEIETQALGLPTYERARLAEHLLYSLDSDPDVDAAWIEEARRRCEQLDRGEIQTIPVQQVMDGLREKLRQVR